MKHILLILSIFCYGAIYHNGHYYVHSLVVVIAIHNIIIIDNTHFWYRLFTLYFKEYVFFFFLPQNGKYNTITIVYNIWLDHHYGW